MKNHFHNTQKKLTASILLNKTKPKKTTFNLINLLKLMSPR